jgi:hypothetical protein
MNWMGLVSPVAKASLFNDVEVYRARNKLYNELMQIQSTTDVM